MTRSLPLTFTLALLLASAPAPALVGGEAKVVPSAVSFQNDIGVCSGTMVSPNIILTAAHCVYHEAKPLKVGSNLLVFGHEGKGTHYAPMQLFPSLVREVIIHPAYIMQDTKLVQDGIRSDIALIVLEANLPLTIAKIGALDSLADKTVLLATGAGCEKDGENATMRMKTGFFPVLKPVNYDLLLSSAEKATGVPATLCSGDSGGGVFLATFGNASNQPTVVAVNSRRFMEGPMPRTAGFVTRLDTVDARALMMPGLKRPKAKATVKDALPKTLAEGIWGELSQADLTDMNIRMMIAGKIYGSLLADPAFSCHAMAEDGSQNDAIVSLVLSILPSTSEKQVAKHINEFWVKYPDCRRR